MKKTLIFAGFMGLLLANTGMAAVNLPAFPADGVTNPTFTGQNNAATNYAAQEDRIKVATTHYVDQRVGEVEAGVNALSGDVSDTQTAVEANADDIADMETGRQTVPGSAETLCNSLSTHTEYSGCGYISPSGTGSNNASDYKWVLIASDTAQPAD